MAMQKKDSDNLISLTDAAKTCKYSQEYLSLRARQGKLKAEKIGRNWLTKKEWLDEYLQRTHYKKLELKPKSKKKLVVSDRIKNIGQDNKIYRTDRTNSPSLLRKLRRTSRTNKEKVVNVPENLPVGEPAEIKDKGFSFPYFSPSIRFAFAFAMVCVLLFTGIIFSKDVYPVKFAEQQFGRLLGEAKQLPNLAGDSLEGVSDFTHRGFAHINETLVSDISQSKEDVKNMFRFAKSAAPDTTGLLRRFQERSQSLLAMTQGGIREIGEMREMGGDWFAGLAMPEMPSVDMSIFRNVEMPSFEMPTIVMPSLPEISLPQFTMPTMPAIPAGPKVSLLELLTPELAIPQASLVKLLLPEIVMPELPDFEMPSLPTIAMPTMPAIPTGPKVSLLELLTPELAIPEASLAELLSPEIDIPRFGDFDMPRFVIPDFNITRTVLVISDDAYLQTANIINHLSLISANTTRTVLVVLDNVDEGVQVFADSLTMPSVDISRFRDVEMPKFVMLSLPEISLVELLEPEIVMPQLPDFVMPSLPEISLPQFTMPTMPAIPTGPKVSLLELLTPELAIPEASLAELLEPEIDMPTFGDVDMPRFVMPDFNITRTVLVTSDDAYLQTANFVGHLSLITDYSLLITDYSSSVVESVTNQLSSINNQLSLISANTTRTVLVVLDDAYQGFEIFADNLGLPKIGIPRFGNVGMSGFVTANVSNHLSLINDYSLFIADQLSLATDKLLLVTTEARYTQRMLAQATAVSTGVGTDYFSWVSDKVSETAKMVFDPIKEAGDIVVYKIYSAEKFALDKFGILKQKFEPKEQTTEQAIVQQVSEDVEKEIQELKSQDELLSKEIERLEREGLPAKQIVREIIKEVEVSKITKVEPVKETTKQTIITKIDDTELEAIKIKLAEFDLWGEDIEELRKITKKLQSRPTSVASSSAPIYIASQGLQVGGHGIFDSIGASGAGSFGNLSVGGSTYLGSSANDRLTVIASSIFDSSITINNSLTQTSGQVSFAGNVDASAGLDVTGADFTVGGTNFVVDVATGNVTVGGNLTVVGAQTYSGAADFTATSAVSALSVNQQGAGNVVLFQNNGADAFVIANSGQLTITSDAAPQLTLGYDATNFLTVGCDASSNITFTSLASLYHIYADTGEYQLQRGADVVFAINTNGSIDLTPIAGQIVSLAGPAQISEAALAIASKVAEDLLFRPMFDSRSLTGTRGQIATYTDDTDSIPIFSLVQDTAGKASGGRGYTTITGTDNESLSYSTAGNIDADDGTISLWYSPSYASTATADRYIFHTDDHLKIYYNGTEGKFYCGAYNGTNYITAEATSAAQTFVADDWLHILCAYDNDNGTATVKLYVNNVETTDADTWTAQALPANMFIGSDISANNQSYGKISDFTIFNRVLTRAEVQQIYYLKQPIQDYAHTTTPYANTATVGKYGADYTTISAALTALSGTSDQPALIQVMPGVYQEAITLEDYVDVIAIGGPEVTTIQQATSTIITAGADNCRLQGFTINKTTDDATTAISLLTYSPTLENLIITGAGVATQIAIDITSGSPQIEDIRISNVNTAITTTTGSPTIINAKIGETTQVATGVKHTGTSGTTTVRYSMISSTTDDIYAFGNGATIVSSNNILQSTTNNFETGTGATIESSFDKYTLTDSDGFLYDLSDTAVYTEANDNVNVGTAVYLSAANTVNLARADSSITMPSIGIVVKEDDTKVWVKSYGIYYEQDAGYTAGESYYVSSGSAGAITVTKPAGELAQVIGVAISTEELSLTSMSGEIENNSYQNVLTVSPDGGGYSTIQSAIDVVASPDADNRWLVLVYPGVYDEVVTLDENYTDLIAIAGSTVTKITQANATPFTCTSSNNIIKGFNFDISADTTGKSVVALNAAPSTVIFEDNTITWVTDGGSDATGIAITTGSPYIKRTTISQVAKAITITTGSPTITQSDITSTDTGISIATGGGTIALTYNSVNATNDDIIAPSLSSATVINSSNNWLRSSNDNFDINTNATVNSYKDTYATINTNSSAGTFIQKDYIRNDTETALTIQQSGAGENLKLEYDTSNYFTVKTDSSGRTIFDAVSSDPDAGVILSQDAIYQPQSSYQADQGLVGYWSFNEGQDYPTTTTAYDISTSENDGTLNGFDGAADAGSTDVTLKDSILSATDDTYNGLELYITGGINLGEHQTISDYDGGTTTITVDTAFTNAIVAGDTYIVGRTDGKYGKGLQFDGHDDYVDCGDDSSLRLGSGGEDFTYSLWVYPHSGVQKVFSSKGRPIGSGSEVAAGFAFGQGGGLSTKLRIEAGDGTNRSYNLGTVNTVILDEWHLYCLVYDRDVGVYVYRDGTLLYLTTGELDGFTSIGNGIGATGQLLLIGDDNSADNSFNGLMDEVRIYNRALSTDEIKAHYLRGAETYTDFAISASTTAGEQYANRIVLTDTGVVTTGTDTSYGEKINVTRTGATDGIIDTYGIHSTVLADNAGSGTSTAVAGYFKATGADTNYSIYAEGQCVTSDTLLPILVQNPENRAVEVKPQHHLRTKQAQELLRSNLNSQLTQQYENGSRSVENNQKTLIESRSFSAVGSGVEPRAGKDAKQVSAAAPTVGEYLPATYRNDIVAGDKKNNNPVSNKDVICDVLSGHVVPTADTYYHYTNSNNLVKTFDVDNIEYVRIDEIKGGEMVLSLNEKTNKIEPARIKALMDMGVKPIYEIVTEDNRIIRTTANHPYLVQTENTEWIKVKHLNPGDKIAVANIDERAVEVKPQHHLRTKQAQELLRSNLNSYENGSRSIETEIVDEVQFIAIKEINLLPAEQVWDIEVEGTHNFVAGHFVEINKKFAINANFLRTAFGSVVPDRQPTDSIANQEFLSRGSGVENKSAVDGTGFEPVGSWMAIQNRNQTPPIANLAYHDDIADVNFGKFFGGIIAHNTYIETTADPQLQLAYDTSNYLTVGVDSSGRTILDAVSSDPDAGVILSQDAIYQPQSSYQADQGLVGYWSFNEGQDYPTTTTAYDISTSENDGTLNGFDGAADAGSTDVTLKDSILSATDDTYNGLELYITGGTNLGEHQTISDYDGGTTTITVDTAFTNAIVAGDTYIVGRADGKYGKGLQFDGHDDYVDCGDDSSLRLGSGGEDFTYSLWVYPHSGVQKVFSSKGRPIGSGSEVAAGFAFGQGGGLSTKLRIEAGDGTNRSYNLGTVNTVILDEWHLYCLVYDRDVGVYVYRDGTLLYLTTGELDGFTSIGNGIGATGQLLLIGDDNSADNNFNGLMDEVRIYDRALSTDEIKAHYLRGSETHTDFAISTTATAGEQYANRIVLTDTGAVTTGADTSYGQHISVTRTGASGTADIDTYGIHSTVTGDTGGVDSVAVGGYFSATSADYNYGLIVANGSVGIGDTSPTYLLDVHASDTTYLTRIYNTSTNAAAAGLYVRTDGDGNLLTLNAGGTDIVTISEAQSTFNNPVSMAAAGDVSIAYDLLMVNATAGNIKFSGPGYIETDSTWQNLDLTLRAANTGKVIVDDTMYISGSVGIGATSPGTLLELASTVPYLTVYNTTEEDTDYGRESEIIFEGEQSGGEHTTLGKIQVAHDGTSNDQKGIMTFKLNDGDDADAPSDVMTLQANGNVGIGTTGPDGVLELNMGTDKQLRLSYNDTDGSAIDYSKFEVGDDGALTITTVDDGAAEGDIILMPDGLVGINIAVPTANLDIKGNLTTALTGTVTVVQNDPGVVGSGTSFRSELRKGDSIKIVAETFNVLSITDDTNLTLSSDYLAAGAGSLTAYKDSNLFYVQNGNSIGAVVVNKSGYLGVGDTSPSSTLTIAASGNLAFGDINDAIIDDMESAEEEEWVESDGTNTNVSTETSIEKVGDGAMKITTDKGSGTITATTIAFVDGGGGSDSFTDTGNGFVAAGFLNGDVIDVTGSTSNDGSYTINAVVEAGTIYVATGSLTAEVAGDTVTIVGHASNTDTIKKSFASPYKDYSSNDRIGFWVRATETGQIFSVKIYDATDATISTHTITIDVVNSWQYEEWNISVIDTTHRDAVEWIEFYIDDDTDSPTIYIDQLRYYDKDNRSGEMFVGADGKLVIAGEQGIQLQANITSSLPALSIDAAIVEINQPFAVNVSGDTGINYDLQFLNTGTTFVTSAGPLVIAAGDPNHFENLTLTTQSNMGGSASGFATATGASTLTDALQTTWAENEWAGGTISILSGTGIGEQRTIASNTTGGQITTTAAWTVTPAIDSYYHMAYARGGDVLVNIANTDLAYGGFKINGMDEGNYIFRVEADGDVHIGGTGIGGSDLTIKQNLTLTGGIITVGQLDPTDAAFDNTDLSENSDQGTGNDQGCDDLEQYYYKITALNDNGETTGSAEATITMSAAAGHDNDDTITIVWDTVEGATKYKIFRSTDQNWGDNDGDDYWVDTDYIFAPTTIYTDDCNYGSTDTVNEEPPTANTTGGKLAINTTSPQARLDVLETTTAAAQMRLTHDGTTYAEFYLDSTGDLNILLTDGSFGDDIRILNENLRICDGSTAFNDVSCPTTGYSISNQGNLIVENKVVADTFERICATGYIWVPGSAKYGTLPGFCVMKYEAKGSSGAVVSTSTGLPYVNISQEDARDECQALSATLGDGYHLMSDPEWMTIAENITYVASNWSGSAVGSGYIFAGHNDNNVTGAKVASSTDTGNNRCAYTDSVGIEAPSPCPTNDAEGESGTVGNQVRVHTLSNGEYIWDIAGNVWEWTDKVIYEDETDGGADGSDAYGCTAEMPDTAESETYVYKSTIAIEDPTAADDSFFEELADNVTFTSIYCKTLVGTATLNVQIAGSDINDGNIVCTIDGVLDESLVADISGAVGEELKLEIASVSAAPAPTYLMVQVNGISVSGETAQDWQEYISIVDFKGLDIVPPNSDTGVGDYNAWNSADGIGKIYINPGHAYDGNYSSAYHAFLRGGGWGSTSNAGVFALSLYNSPAHANTAVGFRCAR